MAETQMAVEKSRKTVDPETKSMKQVILRFDETTKMRIQEELLPAEKRKLTGQLEYLLLQNRDEKQLQQVKDTYTRNTNKVRDEKGIAVKIGGAEYWKGQEQAVKLQLSFTDFAIALLEHWAQPKAAAAKN